MNEKGGTDRIPDVLGTNTSDKDFWGRRISEEYIKKDASNKQENYHIQKGQNLFTQKLKFP